MQPADRSLHAAWRLADVIAPVALDGAGRAAVKDRGLREDVMAGTIDAEPGLYACELPGWYLPCQVILSYAPRGRC